MRFWLIGLFWCTVVCAFFRGRVVWVSFPDLFPGVCHFLGFRPLYWFLLFFFRGLFPRLVPCWSSVPGVCRRVSGYRVFFCFARFLLRGFLLPFRCLMACCDFGDLLSVLLLALGFVGVFAGARLCSDVEVVSLLFAVVWSCPVPFSCLVLCSSLFAGFCWLVLGVFRVGVRFIRSWFDGVSFLCCPCGVFAVSFESVIGVPVFRVSVVSGVGCCVCFGVVWLCCLRVLNCPVGLLATDVCGPFVSAAVPLVLFFRFCGSGSVRGCSRVFCRFFSAAPSLFHLLYLCVFFLLPWGALWDLFLVL